MSNESALDKNIARYINETTMLHKPYNELYKKNTIVTVKVENVVKYGVFVQIQDENKGRGLLHIKKLQNMFVKRIEDFLQIGDIIEDVKIIDVTHESLSFSTLHLKLERKYSEEIHDKTDIQEIKDRIAQRVGIISKDTEKRIENFIKEQRIVPFVMAMSKVIDDFNYDLSIKLVEEIERKARDYL
ncbi:S1 RNA-binding domain-containing protein [Bacillus pseudomycoides]|uniref:S1 RNA-binding domain-containing protein n=1 Tax=Bacillus pseudomycoides TaxID=64104 RepID=UPI0023DA779C|nr:S1 RNA-binding domain-containing protein [Bacillus pseudomycoides]MDF2086776.1 S1 RNA-binding domain-containing protein [Bacillus pseudomycoides]